MNTEYLAVDVTSYSVFDFLRDGETLEQLLNRANLHKQEDISSLTFKCRKYPENLALKKILKNAQKSKYEVMTYDDFLLGQREYYLSDELKKISKERYEEALNVLPPLKWCVKRGLEMFCNREMYDGTYTVQYAKCNDRYYSKMVDVTDESTWIHNILDKYERMV